MTIPAELEGILGSTPDTLHGAVRFIGTRVFVSQLFDYILLGQTRQDFLDDFAGVSEGQVDAALDWQRKELLRQFDFTLVP